MSSGAETSGAGLRWGCYLSPFRRESDNYARQFRYKLQFAKTLEELGFDEMWIGEHRLAGDQSISTPDLFIAAAAEQTRSIKLGAGVVPLPFHHPFVVAERFTFLDHLTRGRVILGVGAGAAGADAWMLGINGAERHRMLAEGLDALLRLLRSDEPLTVETDWFRLREAFLAQPPYSCPHFEVAVASIASHNAAMLAGRHNASLISMPEACDFPGAKLAAQWLTYEAEARRSGMATTRSSWRIVGNMHLADTRDQAIEDVRFGLDHYANSILETGAYPSLEIPGDSFSERVEFILESGYGVIGTVEDAIEHIEALLETAGCFGCFLLLGHDWANIEATTRSWNLFSRYVIPHFREPGSAKRRDMARERLASAYVREHTSRAGSTALPRDEGKLKP